MANPGQSKAVLEEERKLIAVVEDDDQVTSIIVRLLEKEDYLVKTAKDGMDGLRLLEEIRPDLLIVDVMMPRLDGFQFVRALRYIKENKNIPIIFLTARSDARSMIEGINLGAKFFLSKPFQVTDMMNKIKKCLNEGAVRTR
ncbi:MAG: response regulator [Myxococcota bacterium]|mgnify:CR=1 FL=1|jgi:DNA-binding response OmpR family regulator|nr:response regulator [Myxococcota bacterium]